MRITWVIIKKLNSAWSGVYYLFYNITLRHWNNRSLFFELHHKTHALFYLLSTSAAYTHGQIVDAELQGTFQHSTAIIFNELPANIRNCKDFKENSLTKTSRLATSSDLVAGHLFQNGGCRCQILGLFGDNFLGKNAL